MTAWDGLSDQSDPCASGRNTTPGARVLFGHNSGYVGGEGGLSRTEPVPRVGAF